MLPNLSSTVSVRAVGTRLICVVCGQKGYVEKEYGAEKEGNGQKGRGKEEREARR